jgi:hypothetical protein
MSSCRYASDQQQQVSSLFGLTYNRFTTASPLLHGDKIAASRGYF